MREENKIIENGKPINPLEESWKEKYPPIGEEKCNHFDDCSWCNQCYRGGHWQIPEADKLIWEQYLSELTRWNKLGVVCND